MLFLIVAIAAVYLGVHAKWIHDRRTARDWVRKHDGTAWIQGNSQVPSPWGLGLFGEDGATDVIIADSITDDDPSSVARQMKRLFPEASVHLYSLTTYKWTDVE